MINIIRTIKNLSGVDALNNTPSVIDWLTTWTNKISESGGKSNIVDIQLKDSTLHVNIECWKPITNYYIHI